MNLQIMSVAHKKVRLNLSFCNIKSLQNCACAVELGLVSFVAPRSASLLGLVSFVARTLLRYSP